MTQDFEPLKRRLDEEGYVLLPGVLHGAAAASRVSRLNSIYGGLEHAKRHVYPGGIGTAERLILNLHNKDESFIDLVDHPAVFPLVQHLMMSGSYQNSEPFIVTQFSARDPKPGESEQQLHIDSRFPGPPFALMAIALWMMNDFTRQSGATRLVPGSHRRPSYPDNGVTYRDEVQAEAPAGSVLLYNGSLWHGGGAKLAPVERWSVIISYARWFVKPAFDMTRNTPPELYATLTPARRELFGFTSVPPADEHVRARGRIPHDELPDHL